MTPLTIAAPGLLANDIDPNTEPTLSIQSFTNPGHGTLTDNGDGTLTYTASTSYAGDDSFTYTPTDPAGRLDRHALGQLGRAG